MPGIYQGDPDDLEDAMSQPNVVAVVPMPPASVAITFHVHGSEGTRTYIYNLSASEFAEFMADFVGEGGALDLAAEGGLLL